MYEIVFHMYIIPGENFFTCGIYRIQDFISHMIFSYSFRSAGVTRLHNSIVKNHGLLHTNKGSYPSLNKITDGQELFLTRISDWFHIMK